MKLLFRWKIYHDHYLCWNHSEKNWKSRKFDENKKEKKIFASTRARNDTDNRNRRNFACFLKHHQKCMHHNLSLIAMLSDGSQYYVFNGEQLFDTTKLRFDMFFFLLLCIFDAIKIHKNIWEKINVESVKKCRQLNSISQNLWVLLKRFESRSLQLMPFLIGKLG